MKNKTNLDKVKQVSKMLLRAVPIENIVIDGKELPICQHPFTSSTYVYIGKNEFADVKVDNNLSKYYQFMDTKIDKADSFIKLYILIGDAWKLTFFKYVYEYLSEKDYADFLADAWVTEENPNMDVNVSINESINFFKKANKSLLMKKEDYLTYQEFSSNLTVYRGVAINRTALGLSWTTNLEEAKWFANRFNKDDKKGYVQVLEVKKEDILAYFNIRREDEVVVDILQYKGKIKRI